MSIQGQLVDILTAIDPKLYGNSVFFEHGNQNLYVYVKKKSMEFWYQKFYSTRSLGNIWKAPDSNLVPKINVWQTQ